MKKILVPTDFSQPAQWALETAIPIARKIKAEIILLHIVEQAINESFNVEGEVASGGELEDKLFTLKLIQKEKQQLAEACNLVEEYGIPVKPKLRLGNPFHGIQAIIAEHDVDLVVMGTSGHTKIEEMLVGSNTEKVVRKARCPVLAVHHKPSGKDFNNIVYASSLSENEKSFAEVVRDVQEIFNATIHLVRINTPLNFQPDYLVRVALKSFARKIRLQKYTINSYSDQTEEEGILHFASDINADLIVMATHGRTGFARVLAGSIAEDVVVQSALPVLTSLTG
ncbi:MAG TPA: universal stress protein [Cyclobacteriaceae bacterium]|nr:universal stress protein [Cyclobacteriaceae bacterium]